MAWAHPRPDGIPYDATNAEAKYCFPHLQPNFTGQLTTFAKRILPRAERIFFARGGGGWGSDEVG